MKILADSNEYRIVLYKQKHASKKLIITFDPHGADIRNKGFASDFIIDSGYDHIFVSHKIKTQYQGLSAEQFKNAVIHEINNREVYTYGSSLGGYCAIYYAGQINAKAISFSPRNSAHPLLRGKIVSSSFKGLEYKHTTNLTPPFSQHTPLIIYDPKQEADVQFLKHYILSAYPNSTLIEVPYAGHMVTQAMQEIGALKDFVLAAIDDQTMSFSVNEHNSSYWNIEKAEEHYKAGNIEESVKHLIKALDINKKNEIAQNKLIYILRKSKARTNVSSEYFKALEEIIEKSELFSQEFYLSKYRDVANHPRFAKEPILHYLIYGSFEGRNPSEHFNTGFYLNNNPDVQKNEWNPLIHYIKYGIKEGRRPT